ncbi:MAG: alpha/beta fold hydrolase, partial [Chromatocurvus sp.]
MTKSDRIELNVASEGDGPDIILLHGLFGMGSNLGALGRSLRDAYRVHLVDLPDHGRSAWTQHSDLRGMAGALAQWLQSQSIAGAHCVGHSLGGKVAMQFALDHPAAAASIVVADIAPVAYSRSHDEVFAALNAVSAVECQSRTEADTILSGYLDNPNV